MIAGRRNVRRDVVFIINDGLDGARFGRESPAEEDACKIGEKKKGEKCNGRKLDRAEVGN